jgi:UDP-N-acetylmuramyl pentapeptide phosphotransferase/UDP-N-acetylglucosamine-1-phosphate transferase
MDKIDAFLEAHNFSSFYLKFILSFITSLSITYFSIPTIIKISRRKNLMDEPGQRSSHEKKIPNLGGVAIFLAISVSSSIFAYQLFDLYKFLFASLIILLYIGVMDDIVSMRAHNKLLAQVIVATMLVIGSDVRIRSFFGVFGLHELNYFLSIIISIFTFIILINAFNLIDGIDGLAGTYAVVCFAMFGISYFRLGEYNYPLVIFSTAIIGSVMGFLYYNLSDKAKKIFMGDTGSMVVGFLLAFTAMCFLDIFIAKRGIYYYLEAAPAIAVGILILPIVDTLNVIIIRIAKKRSPLEADKNHIHHKLLKLGLSHKKATFCIILYFLFIVAVAYFLRHIEVNFLLGIVLTLGFIGAYLPDLFMKNNNNI